MTGDSLLRAVKRRRHVDRMGDTMAQILLHENIRDFAQWKRVFDERSATRGESGSRGYRMYRNSSNPDELFIIMDWESNESAREYANSPGLKAAIERAGVTTEPGIYVLEEIDSKVEGAAEGGTEQIAS